MQREWFKQIEHLQNREALGRCRGLKNRHVPIGALNGLAPARGLGCQIGLAEKTTVLRRKAGQFRADLAAIEANWTLRCHRLQRLGQVRVGEHGPGNGRPALGHKDRARLGMGRQIILDAVDPAGKPLRDWKTIARVANRAFQTTCQGEPPIGCMGLAPTGHRTWRGQCARKNASKRNLTVTALLEPIDARTGRSPATAVQVTHATGFGIVNEPERVATDASHVRVQHRQGRAGGNRCIHGRAARPQYIDPGLRRQRMRASDHSFWAHGDWAASGDLQSCIPSNVRCRSEWILHRKKTCNAAHFAPLQRGRWVAWRRLRRERISSRIEWGLRCGGNAGPARRDRFE